MTNTPYEINEWIIIANELLKRSTGVEWTIQYKIDLWDFEFRFKQGEFEYISCSMSFTQSKESNFRLFFMDIGRCLMRWIRQNE